LVINKEEIKALIIESDGDGIDPTGAIRILPQVIYIFYTWCIGTCINFVGDYFFAF